MKTDVIIVGFGPVGAALAGLLGRRGLSVAVIERDTNVFPHPRAAHIDHTGLRLLQELGCLDEAQRPMIRNRRLDLVDARHRVLASVPADQPSVSNLPASMYFYQPDFDRILRRTVQEIPNCEMHLGEELLDFEQSAEGVKVRSRGRDGVEHVREASWMVGCDGAWSPVREQLGIRLESLDFDEQWLVLDLKLNSPQPGVPADRVVQVCDPERPHLTTPIAEGRQRFEFMLMPGEDPAQMQQPGRVKELLASWMPADAFEIERSAIYTFHGLVAEEWRKGRVLIAGDAAHQMPPFLGQGMCSGLRDASNLAWKLDMVANGQAEDSLLATYQAERGPHVRGVVEVAIAFGRIVCELDPEKVRERDRYMREGAPTRGMTFTLPRLEDGLLVLDGGGSLFVQPSIGGRWLDDIVGQRFLVVGRDRARLGDAAAWWARRLGAFVTTLDELPDDGTIARWLDRKGAGVVVVRPDRYVLGEASTLDEITAEVKQVFGGGAKVYSDSEKALLAGPPVMRWE
ncbi:bifunctional 3-(3-hydroxy-phenyl)propionate/3-hydroxycinnamic acid hydroxylase [Amorphus sp. MBR-141]